MKRILVPCDFTPTAINAFRFACEIASKTKGEVFLLNIVELPNIRTSMVVPIQAYKAEFLKKRKEKVEKQFLRIKKMWGNKLKVHFDLESGSVLSSIKKFSLKKRVDLIVVGTHGSSGIREFTIGSNTEKIVRTSTVPVIAVKKTVGISSVKDIIYPTDLSRIKGQFLTRLKKLQETLNATLHILYINKPVNFSGDLSTGEKLNSFVTQNHFRNFTINIFNDFSEEQGITNFSTLFKNKIIAMYTHGRPKIAHLIMGSIAENIVNHIDCPIWTYAPEKK